MGEIRARIAAARPSGGVALVAVSKRQPIAAIRALAARGQHAFGENYVQEAQAKARELTDLPLAWHLIGPLQSNKCREAAQLCDWVQSVDRAKLVGLLARHRPPDRPPLDVLVQVNVDDEASKSGVAPGDAEALCDAIAAQPRLRLRGLMAIPAPHPDPGERRAAFARMRSLFDALASGRPAFDTLSMGMSDDFEIAIAEGATMVRIGTALFGPRQG
ncbi:MAG TPA: YggS family pyridoxal phosphate-dependent enzyme [Xanthomonadales bacterium]|nr:YggS family pyridoxal phosphate-dependent enzyme [Xanthomonadales bacterium]